MTLLKLKTLKYLVQWYSRKYYNGNTGEAGNTIDTMIALLNQHINDKWRR